MQCVGTVMREMDISFVRHFDYFRRRRRRLHVGMIFPWPNTILTFVFFFYRPSAVSLSCRSSHLRYNFSTDGALLHIVSTIKPPGILHLLGVKIYAQNAETNTGCNGKQ